MDAVSSGLSVVADTVVNIAPWLTLGMAGWGGLNLYTTIQDHMNNPSAYSPRDWKDWLGFGQGNGTQAQQGSDDPGEEEEESESEEGSEPDALDPDVHTEAGGGTERGGGGGHETRPGTERDTQPETRQASRTTVPIPPPPGGSTVESDAGGNLDPAPRTAPPVTEDPPEETGSKSSRRDTRHGERGGKSETTNDRRRRRSRNSTTGPATRSKLLRESFRRLLRDRMPLVSSIARVAGRSRSSHSGPPPSKASGGAKRSSRTPDTSNIPSVAEECLSLKQFLNEAGGFEPRAYEQACKFIAGKSEDPETAAYYLGPKWRRRYSGALTALSRYWGPAIKACTGSEPESNPPTAQSRVSNCFSSLGACASRRSASSLFV